MRRHTRSGSSFLPLVPHPPYHHHHPCASSPADPGRNKVRWVLPSQLREARERPWRAGAVSVCLSVWLFVCHCFLYFFFALLLLVSVYLFLISLTFLSGGLLLLAEWQSLS